MGPRIAPVCPVIADKVRSYGGGIPYLPVTCKRALPANRAQGALLQGSGVGGAA